MQLPKARPRRRVQHGRRRGGQLRVDPGARVDADPDQQPRPSADRRPRGGSPTAPALIWRDRTWTWAEFDARVQCAAGALAEQGVRHGDRVLVHARNCNAVLEIDVRVLDARRGLGADQLPADAAGGRLSRASRPVPPCISSMPRSPNTRRRRGRKIPACAAGMSRSVTASWRGRRWSTSGAGSSAAGGCRSRRSGWFFYHLRHHRAAEGRRADAWPDGISSSATICAT